MLPVVASNETTAWQIFWYTLALLPVTLLLVYPLQVMGAVYCAVALLLGGIFVQKAWSLMQAASDRLLARSLFKYSILYMMLLCAGMTIDSLPVIHQFTNAITANLLGLASMMRYCLFN